MVVRRHKHDAVLLRDGRVLITGGSDERDGDGAYVSTEFFDPGAGAFIAGPSMVHARYKHQGSARTLPTGDVLVAGGAANAEVYDAKAQHVRGCRAPAHARIILCSRAAGQRPRPHHRRIWTRSAAIGRCVDLSAVTFRQVHARSQGASGPRDSRDKRRPIHSGGNAIPAVGDRLRLDLVRQDMTAAPTDTIGASRMITRTRSCWRCPRRARWSLDWPDPLARLAYAIARRATSSHGSRRRWCQ